MSPTPAVVNLNDGALLDPREHLSDRWRSLQIVRLDGGARRELVSDGVEHAVYVLGGDGTARTETQAVPLERGIALTAPKGTELTLEAGAEGLECFHVVLAVG